MKTIVAALALALSAPALANNSELRTDPKTWSKAGWNSLRWGMGPGDARAVMAEGFVFETAWENTLGEDAGLMSYALQFRAQSTLFDDLWDVALHFVGHRLMLVQVKPVEPEPKTTPWASRTWAEGWGVKARRALEAKYGKQPGCEFGECRWSSTDTNIYFSLHRPQAGIAYSDRAYDEAERKRAEKTLQADMEKL